ncbi:TPA: RES domain-containing protein [Serratia marcescens]|nr:RES domain-containing protein [Serratia marcescens]
MDNESRVCHGCIGESYVKSFVQRNGDVNGKCEYCRSRKKSIPLVDVAGMMHSVFLNFYYPITDDECYYSGRNGDSADQIISDELGLDSEDLTSDILEILKSEFDSSSPDEYSLYDYDFLYANVNYDSGELDVAWDKMLDSLKSESRYFNKGVKIFLDNLFSDIESYKIAKDKSPVDEIKEQTKFYRARVFESYDLAEKSLKNPEREFGPPPSNVARSGRMNAAGIPVFYGASSPDIAIAEVRPAVGSFVIVAPFVAMRPLRVLNISAMDMISNGEQSKFNPDTLTRQQKTSFLKTLSKKLTIPVVGKNPDSEYLITQAVAEYLSITDKFSLDGITFRSTQVNKKRQNKSEYYNIVLFNKSSKVFESDNSGLTYRTEIWENVEDEYFMFSPKIRRVERKVKRSFLNNRYSFNVNDSVLKLKADEMTFHSIRGVVFQTKKTLIELGETIQDESTGSDNDLHDF